MTTIEHSSARLATLNQLLQTVIPAYLTPPPSAFTLRVWFDQARIPRFKSNPTAKRGGGTVFYSVAAVEKFLQSRTLPCRLPAVVFEAPGAAKTDNPSAN
jgi:hypothetical protein